jgi:hypothetical protein
MGCQSDAEALLHIGAEPAFEPLLAATLQDARQPGQPGHQRNTQAAALEWLGAPPGRLTSLPLLICIETCQDSASGRLGGAWHCGITREWERVRAASRTSPGPRPQAGRAGSKVKQSGQSRGFGGGPRRAGGSARSKTDEARDLLANVVLCHIPCPRYDFQDKARPPPYSYPARTAPSRARRGPCPNRTLPAPRLPGQRGYRVALHPAPAPWARAPCARPPRACMRRAGVPPAPRLRARRHAPGAGPGAGSGLRRRRQGGSWLRAARPQERWGRLARGSVQACGLLPVITKARARARARR